MQSSLKFKDLGSDFFAQVSTQKLENTSLIHTNDSLKQELSIKSDYNELLSISLVKSLFLMKVQYLLSMQGTNLDILYLS